jgi:type II secretory pathway pseudopilin PulG
MTMERTNASPHNGFTLVELMVAAAASFVVIGIIMSSVVTFQQMSQRMDDKLKQEAEIERALNFIAADIQEGNLIQPGAPQRDGYNALFQIKRPDNETIGYYTTPRGSLFWSGPQIIYRKDSRDVDFYALIDQISVEPPVGCKITDPKKDVLVSSRVGFGLIIHNESKATVCIRGHLKDNPDSIEGSIQAATRVRAEP